VPLELCILSIIIHYHIVFNMTISAHMKKAGTAGRRLSSAALILSMFAGLTVDAWAQDASGSSVPASSANTSQQLRSIDAIAAVVNSEVITYKELEERMRMIERRMSKQGVAMPPRAQLQRQLLERMIVDRAQLQLAKEVGIRVDDGMLDRAVARIAEQNKLSMQDFRTQLEREGTPYSKFREEIRAEIIMQRLREREVANKIQITEAEVDNFIEASTGAQANQQEFNLSHILVRVPENATAEQISQRRQRAEEAMQQLKAGSDFVKVAAIYSDASDSLKGGEIGWRSLDRLPQLFVDAIANLNPGEVSPIVKSANGFHILKVVGKRSPSVMKGGDADASSAQQTRARHILIRVNEVVSATEARRKLLELKERLDNNAAKFEELAKLYSNDGSAGKGGDLGWVYPGDTVPEFERAMDALRPGQISEPIESPFGYHLIQVVERRSGSASQERQRMMARQAIRERKLEEATEDWLRQVRDRAYVEYRTQDEEFR
jgi:peptidyl-prolyl cis-trans isomerase SurA